MKSRKFTPEEIRAGRAAAACRVPMAMAITGLGRNAIYRLINSGALPSKKVGGTRIIDTVALENLVQS